MSRRILYIEDNKANIELMKAILVTVPALTIETAQSAELGLELTSQHIPVIAISAAAMKQDVEKATKAGFYAYLTKPFNIPELLGMIDDLLPNDG